MKTISLKNVKDGLNRDEMRAVKGGSGGGPFGSCCANAGGTPVCGLSRETAQRVASNYGSRWCCDSCSTATWM